jgi:hypothetical protein
MSLIIFKDDTGKQLFNKILKKSQTKYSRQKNEEISYLNSSEKCIVCGCGETYDIESQILVPFTKHHVSYFPQVIAYVHCKCHQKIHESENPISVLVQYQEGDSLRFYNSNKQGKKSIGVYQ